MKISKVVKFKYIYVFMEQDRYSGQLKKKMEKKNGAAFIEARAV